MANLTDKEAQIRKYFESAPWANPGGTKPVGTPDNTGTLPGVQASVSTDPKAFDGIERMSTGAFQSFLDFMKKPGGSPQDQMNSAMAESKPKQEQKQPEAAKPVAATPEEDRSIQGAVQKAGDAMGAPKTITGIVNAGIQKYLERFFSTVPIDKEVGQAIPGMIQEGKKWEAQAAMESNPKMAADLAQRNIPQDLAAQMILSSGQGMPEGATGVRHGASLALGQVEAAGQVPEGQTAFAKAKSANESVMDPQMQKAQQLEEISKKGHQGFGGHAIGWLGQVIGINTPQWEEDMKYHGTRGASYGPLGGEGAKAALTPVSPTDIMKMSVESLNKQRDAMTSVLQSKSALLDQSEKRRDFLAKAGWKPGWSPEDKMLRNEITTMGSNINLIQAEIDKRTGGKSRISEKAGAPAEKPKAAVEKSMSKREQGQQSPYIEQLREQLRAKAKPNQRATYNRLREQGLSEAEALQGAIGKKR